MELGRDLKMGLLVQNGWQALIKILAYPARTATCVQNETLFTDCKEPITLAPEPGKVPVKCDDYTDESNEGIKYLCKANQFDCEEISPKTMSIPVQTDNDYGSYWCGLKFSTYRVLFQEVSVISECYYYFN